MTDVTAINSWEHWSDFLFRLGAINTPAEFQGFTAGLLAGGGALDADKWLKLAEEFMDLPEPVAELEPKAALNAYFLLAERALADKDYGYRLLLPDDALPIAKRAEALGAWSESFLVGFGMTCVDAEQLDEDGKDMLENLAQIAQIDSELDDAEENEGLYTELCEFIRVAAMYLYQLNQHLAQQSDNQVPDDLGDDNLSIH